MQHPQLKAVTDRHKAASLYHKEAAAYKTFTKKLQSFGYPRVFIRTGEPTALQEL